MVNCKYCGRWLSKDDYDSIPGCFGCVSRYQFANTRGGRDRTAGPKDPERAALVKQMRDAGLWKKS